MKAGDLSDKPGIAKYPVIQAAAVAQDRIRELDKEVESLKGDLYESLLNAEGLAIKCADLGAENERLNRALSVAVNYYPHLEYLYGYDGPGQ